jgi:hypothetical protein
MVTADFKIVSEETIYAGKQSYQFIILERLKKEKQPTE